MVCLAFPGLGCFLPLVLASKLFPVLFDPICPVFQDLVEMAGVNVRIFPLIKREEKYINGPPKKKASMVQNEGEVDGRGGPGDKAKVAKYARVKDHFHLSQIKTKGWHTGFQTFACN